MKIIIKSFSLFIISSFALFSQEQSSFFNNLTPGSFTPGFRHEEKIDFSRSYLSPDDGTPLSRKIHAYIWYPSIQSDAERMQFNEYVKLTAEDLGMEEDRNEEWPFIPIPVLLDKGMSREQLKELWNTRTASVKNNESAEGQFPLIILGQGLYYESPLSQFILCEYLASHGFVVITSPLVGTYYRLVNINPVDVETQVRDMEFLISVASNLPFVDKGKIGVCGYDLGGISGLLFCMRQPQVKAFLSLDCSILIPHYTGLPNTHQNYNEDQFNIPWMHITQSRVVNAIMGHNAISSLYDRKIFGDSYLLSVSTTNHGSFTSYSNLNITNPILRYSSDVSQNPKKIFHVVCESALNFFNVYLKQKRGSLEYLKNSLEDENKNNPLVEVRIKSGEETPQSKSFFVNLIIEKGFDKALPEIENARKEYADSLLFDENALNWLGYHFLYWWGRENEAVELFKMIVSVYPNSANAYDSLGEAYMIIGENDQAIKNYEKSLELNPDNQNAKNLLEQLRNKN